MDWKLEHCYGDKGPQEEPVEGDIISAVEYDPSGHFIALGDRAGRITILERRRHRENGQKKETTDFKQHVQFQSHESEFDYLKSVEIEEKINQIQWLNQRNHSLMLLATNDKTIKLWKIHEKRNKTKPPSAAQGNTICVPAVPVNSPTEIGNTLKRTFANAHAYHVNSISVSSDSETFLSADDLRINMWHLDHSESLNIVDIKPANMEDLTEVITSASFHPQQCSAFLYSTSKGAMKMGDLRDARTVSRYSKVFEMEEDANSKTFFSEIISSISDAKFSKDGRYILSRDYLTLKIWDVNMERRPLKVLNIHEPLRAKLCDLYENDGIFDKFECAWSPDGKFALTGSYKNHFKVNDVTSLQAKPGSKPSQNPTLTFEAAKPKSKTKSKLVSLRKFGGKGNKTDETYDKVDFNKKVLHLTVHPIDYEISVAALNNLFVFSPV
eukprot:NODE_206_length_2028_cov_263.108135_g162_i0.p1 GENE.NODE_206_length_2028_cov_263.108135_g162_i0~~NODE_206_length_2028_cov_263.108135_g162_i0.p1  ORF type:complete len:440 (-),score=111.91 NODE_206_length_2028_cov_263.108135_g162_i0:649-1968(-)